MTRPPRWNTRGPLKSSRFHAAYDIVNVTGEYVYVVDVNGPISVTNDAEAVVREVHSRWPDRRIVYRDTDGNWDELLHKGGMFMDFKPWRQIEKGGLP